MIFAEPTPPPLPFPVRKACAKLFASGPATHPLGGELRLSITSALSFPALFIIA